MNSSNEMGAFLRGAYWHLDTGIKLIGKFYHQAY
jgi:hypothetical protein